MHDPLTKAWEIPRPWPKRTALKAAPDGVRWRIRLHHDHHEDCHCPSNRYEPFPWWRPGSYSKFWRVAGRDFYWAPVVIIWHREPGGRDGRTKCGGWRTTRNGSRRFRGSWKYHVHHWKIQLPPVQEARRRLLTRCEACGGKSVKGRPVNMSHSWHTPKTRLWRGERGLYHADCA